MTPSASAPVPADPQPIAAPEFHGVIGAACGDITPPAGVHNRCWAASAHQTASGIHRPLSAAALVIAGARPLVLLAFDGSWWQSVRTERRLRDAVAAAVGTDADAVMTCLSHSHSAVPLLEPEDYQGLAGGAEAQAWFERMVATCAGVAAAALAGARPAILQWARGRCPLARNRDLLTKEGWLVGCNPAAPADDTLLAGRVVDSAGVTLATLVSYACHPTTLAWDNRLISPDWPGAMREVVEAAHHGPCLFLQGASGELAPADQYSGDPALADRHGRMVGHAACAALAGLATPGHALAFAGSLPSGAAVGLWRERQVPRGWAGAAALRCERLDLRLPLRSSLETLEQLDAALAAERDPALAERLRRRRRVRLMFSGGTQAELPVWCWRLGRTLLVAVAGEPFSAMQQELRAAFPDFAVIVVNHGNGGSGYLMPEACYQRAGFYPAWQTPFGPGSLEQLVAASRACLQELAAEVGVPAAMPALPALPAVPALSALSALSAGTAPPPQAESAPTASSAVSAAG